jgi:hypothetical protein
MVLIIEKYRYGENFLTVNRTVNPPTKYKQFQDLHGEILRYRAKKIVANLWDFPPKKANLRSIFGEIL